MKAFTHKLSSFLDVDNINGSWTNHGVSASAKYWDSLFGFRSLYCIKWSRLHLIMIHKVQISKTMMQSNTGPDLICRDLYQQMNDTREVESRRDLHQYSPGTSLYGTRSVQRSHSLPNSRLSSSSSRGIRRSRLRTTAAAMDSQANAIPRPNVVSSIPHSLTQEPDKWLQSAPIIDKMRPV